MSVRLSASLAWPCWAVIMILTLISLALRLPTIFPAPDMPGEELLLGALTWLILVPAAVPAYASVGAVVASRRPNNAVGWLCLAVSLVIVVEDVLWHYSSRVYQAGSDPQLAGEPAVWLLTIWAAMLFPLPFTLLLLVFPTGRHISPRWRYVTALAVAGATLAGLGSVLQPRFPAGQSGTIPNPIAVAGLEPASELVTRLAGGVTNLALLIGAVSLVVRWRRAEGRERKQLDVLAYTVGVVIVAGAAALVGTYVMGRLSYPLVLLGGLAVGAFTIGVPVSMGVAILRHRLYDIDTVVNRTLVYGALTASLAAVYFGGVAVLQSILRGVTGQESSLAVVASTLAIAALFGPLRRRIQLSIDRRFYRRRYDMQRTLQAYGASLRDEVDLDSLTSRLVDVVQETMQPAHAGLWLRRVDGLAGRVEPEK